MPEPSRDEPGGRRESKGSNHEIEARHMRDFEMAGIDAGRPWYRGRGSGPERLTAFEVAVPTWALGMAARASPASRCWASPPTSSTSSTIAPRSRPAALVARAYHHTSRGRGGGLCSPCAATLRTAAWVSMPSTLDTFQDQPGQPRSYRHGSLTSSDPAVRAQAVAHNLDCIAIGRQLGSTALTVWIGDGSNYPGQSDLTRSFERYLDSARQIYEALPADWTMMIEHKLFEPAFYATVIQDWGSSYLAATALGPKATCLVDLGHHAPTVNIEMIVARLAWAGRLAGFHFNDSKYGDDDLDSGSIQPFQLFLVFNELIEAERRANEPFAPAYMMDQSHNVTDPIESLCVSADAIQCAFARAQLVDREALHAAQDSDDVIVARGVLQEAYQTDVRPLVAEVRRRRGGAINPVTAYRLSGYREDVAATRRPVQPGTAGIV